MGDAMQVAALSDVGCRRRNNEDSFGYDHPAGIYVISDGMGGSAGGEVASHTAVQQTLASYLAMRAARDTNPMPLKDMLYFAVMHANSAVYERAGSDPQLTGMGATLVAVCVEGRKAVVANLGDSRAYLLRGGSCSQITEDHSLAAEQLRHGMPETAVTPATRNVITRAIGVASTAEPDLFAAELLTGDRLLLATDGLMKHVTDPEIQAIVQAADTVGHACAGLIHAVKERGAHDNVTCLLLQA